MQTERTSSSIIKKLDKHLLKNFPVTWSSRIHIAGIFAIGFFLLLTILSFIVPNEPRDNSQVEYWITLISIISLLAFIFWLIFLLRFNVFKRYGTWSNIDSLKSFIFYFIIILIVISWPFVPPAIESVRANAAYSTSELAKDINDMNIKLCQLERDSIDTGFERDTFEINNEVMGQERRIVPPTISPSSSTDEVTIVTGPNYREDYYYVDTLLLRSKLEEADSVQKISDSIYVIYDCPNYRFINEYNIADQSEQVMTSMDLYRQVLKYRQLVDKDKIRKELGELLTKYDRYHNPVTLTSRLAYDHYYGDMTYETKIREKYDLTYVNSGLDNIADKKYRWDEEMIEICWRVTYYITLCLTMLVFIYRHTTRRTFFLSLLAAVVLTILTSLFTAMSHGSDNALFVWSIIYFVVFIVLSSLIAISRNRTLVSGIGLNLLVFMTPFMPLIITAYYYQTLRDRYMYSNYYNAEEYRKLFENEEYHFFLSEIGGALLLILLLATFYQKAYKKWYSLPEL